MCTAVPLTEVRRAMNILHPSMVDTDMPSPEAVCDVGLDLELDISNSASVKFSYPVWSENDALSKELTDSILTENFSSATENFSSAAEKQQLCYGTSITNEHLLNDTSSATVASDLVWNAFQGIEQFYYGNNKDFDDANADAMLDNTDISDLLIFQVDSMIDSNASKNNNNENILETNTDPLSDVYSSDEAFELDLFDECLKDVDTIVSSQGFNTASDFDSFSAGLSTSVVDWDRRRSLLYDKNEFNRYSSDSETTCRRRQETISRVKSRSASDARAIPIVQRTYKCSVRNCEKTYCKASHLKSHMRRHSGVKPFACDWNGCKWRFSRSDELARHKRSHSGVKPYSCDLCEKAFSRSDHLSKHSKVHMKKLALYGTPIITKKCNYKYLSVNRI